MQLLNSIAHSEYVPIGLIFPARLNSVSNLIFTFSTSEGLETSHLVLVSTNFTIPNNNPGLLSVYLIKARLGSLNYGHKYHA